MNGGAICNGGVAFEARRIRFCPTEGKRRRAYERFQHYYGWASYCLGCGDCWQDGEMGSRPFARAWRKDAIARHKASWDRVTVWGSSGWDRTVELALCRREHLMADALEARQTDADWQRHEGHEGEYADPAGCWICRETLETFLRFGATP